METGFLKTKDIFGKSKTKSLGSQFGGGWSIADLVKKEQEAAAGIKTSAELFDITPKPQVETPQVEEIFTLKLEEMKVQENNIKSMSKTYAELGSSLDIDYKQYEDLGKQLDEIEVTMAEAPPEMQFSLNQKRNDVAVQYNTLVDKLKTETKRHQTLFTQLDTESKSFNMNVNAYNQYVQKEAAETSVIDYIPEGDLKDNFDAFRLGASGIFHNTKQYYNAALPNLIFADVTSKDQEYYKLQGLPYGMSEEQIENANKINKRKREIYKEKYEKAEANYDKWLVDNPELVPRPEWSEGVIDSIKKDPKILLDPAYWGYVAAQSAAFTIGIMGTTLAVTTVTGNPLLGMAAGVAVAYPSQAQDLWQELVDNGATEEQASKLAVPIGLIIAGVEVMGDLPLLAAVSKPFRRLLRINIAKTVGANVAKGLLKTGAKRFFAVEGAEILEELIQGGIQDATVKTFNENIDMLEKVPETIVQTAIATVPFALVGVGGVTRSNINERLKSKIAENKLKTAVETLKPVEILEKPELPKEPEKKKVEPEPPIPKVELEIPEALEPLAVEARKYESAEEFVGSLPKTRNKNFGDSIEIEVKLPVSEYLYGYDSDKVEKITQKRKVTEPVIATVEGIGSEYIEIIDGNNRLAQAIFNNDKTIPAKLIIPKDIITDVYNKAKKVKPEPKPPVPKEEPKKPTISETGRISDDIHKIYREVDWDVTTLRGDLNKLTIERIDELIEEIHSKQDSYDNLYSPDKTKISLKLLNEVRDSKKVKPEVKPGEEAEEERLKVGDLVKWRGDTSGRIDRVTKVVKGTFGGIEYMTEETNPPPGQEPKIGKQFWDRFGKYKDRGIERVEGPPKVEPKEPWQMTRKEYIGDKTYIESAKNEHIQSVIEAVKAGKPVPTEVLADYPELQDDFPQIPGVPKEGIPKTAISEPETLKALEEEAVRLGRPSWDKLTQVEIRNLLSKVKAFKDPGGKKLLKKVGVPTITVWKDEKFAQIGVLAGEKVHKVTDSHWMFIDEQVADAVIEDQKKRMYDKEVKDYMRKFPDVSKAQADEFVTAYLKGLTEGKDAAVFPSFEGVLENAEGKRTKDKVYIQGHVTNGTVLSNGEIQVIVDSNYLNMMNKWLPDAEIQLGKIPTDMISFVDKKNKIQAVLMPIRYDLGDIPFNVWDIPGGVKPTAEEIARKERDLAEEKRVKEEEGAFLKRPVKKQETLIPGMEEPEIIEEQELSARQWGQVMEKEAVGKETISKTNIMTWAEKAFGFPIKSKATHRWKAAGVFYGHKQIIRMAKWGELAVAAHEIAHGIDQQIAKKLFNKWKWGKLKGITGEFAKELADLDYDQNQRRTSEGFAEYMRFELTQGLGKEKAPGFHKYFNESILPQFPEIKKNLDIFRTKLDIWNKQGAENRIIQHIDWKGEQTEIRGLMPKLRKALEWVNIRFNDEFYLPQKIVKGIEKIIGKKIRPSQNPAILMEYSKAKSGAIARTFVMDKAIDEHGNVVGDSLSDILKPIPNRLMKQFIAFSVSARALNLQSRDIESGFDSDDVKFLFNKRKKEHPEWILIADQVTKWSNHMLDWVVRAGGLSEESAKLMRDLNPIYLPFKRAFLEEVSVIRGVGGYVDTGKAVKAIKGSGRPIINPLESLITQTRELIAKSQKIRIAKAFIDLADEHGVGGFITKVPAPMKATTFKADQIKKYLNALIKERTKDIDVDIDEAIMLGNYDDLLTVFTQDWQYRGKENIVTIWKNGKQEFYEIHPDLYEAFKGVDPLKLGPIGKVLAPYARMLRLGATGLKLSFGLARNPFRDAFSYVVFSKRNNTTIFDPIKGFYKDVFTKPGEATWRFKKLGGGLSGQIGLDRASVQNSYDEMLDLKLGKLGKVLHIVKHPINTLSDIVSITEMGPRSAEIEASYKKYTSEKWQKDHPDWTEEDAFIQAFIDAQDVTVNFTKSGKWAKQLNQVTAFFNVSIRGPEKLYRSIKERPIQTFVKGTLWLTTIAVASWYRNKDKDWYKNLPTAYKYNNLFFEIGGNVFRLPIPFELGIIFMAAPQAALDTMKDQDTKSLEGLLDLAKAQIPNPIPSVFQPALNVATNKNYLGVPIESEGMQYLYPTERKRDYTTKAAIALSKGMDKIGIQLSPIQLDYMLDSYSGGFLRQFRITGEELADLPVIGDLMLRDPSYPKRQLNEYFSDWEYLRQRKQSGIATRAELRKLNRIDGFYKTYKTLQGNITKAKKANNQILVEKYSNIMRERLERYGYK